MPRAVRFSRYGGPEVLEVVEPAEPVSKGRLTVPIGTVYPLEQVQEAYRQVQQRHTRGKIVLSLVPPDERPAPAAALRA
ncbi:zinc-binding dehydrogenase [Streptomyces sp. NPDC058420]|uniref:zinc-binding dehydrogenase n=1 Tax=Streptomyces sp. NPDC058420 TaxID=3346489 RepID=UPI003652B56B